MKRVGPQPASHLLIPVVSSSDTQTQTSASAVPDTPVPVPSAPTVASAPVTVPGAPPASASEGELHDFITAISYLSWRVDYLRTQMKASAHLGSSEDACTTDEDSPSTHSGCSTMVPFTLLLGDEARSQKKEDAEGGGSISADMEPGGECVA